jgi:hypothetical protein
MRSASIWMAFHGERESTEESPACGHSISLLGCPGRYGAEALAAPVLALYDGLDTTNHPPPESTGPADSAKPYKHWKWAGLMLNTNVVSIRTGSQATAPWREVLVKANDSMSLNSTTNEKALRRTRTASYIANVVSSLSLWIPVLAAIWLARGWIGLFFSGQVLSAGACFLHFLTKRTSYAFSASKKPAHEFENG